MTDTHDKTPNENTGLRVQDEPTAVPGNAANAAPSAGRRAVVQGSLLTGGVLVVLALWAMVNYLGMRHYERFDWTSTKIYSLSEKTKNILRDLDRDVQIVVLIDPGSEVYAQVDELVDRYVASNPARIVRRDLDRAKNVMEFQTMMAELGIERANSVVVASDGDKRVIEQYDLVEFDYSGAAMGQPPAIKAFKGEEKITSAILGLAEADKPKVVFTEGHGETGFDATGLAERSLGEARRLLGGDNFDLESWSSIGGGEVPAGTDLLVIAAPTAVFAPPELDAVARYVDGGGRLLVFLEPTFETGSTALKDVGLGDLLARYGIVADSMDVVVDPGSTYAFFGPDTIFTDRFGSHPVVEALQQTLTPVLLSGLTSVQVDESLAEVDGLRAVELVRTSEDGWGETDLAGSAEGGVVYDEADLEGPLAVAAAVSFGGPEKDVEDEDLFGDDLEALAAEGEDGDDSGDASGDDATESTDVTESRIIVFGDLDFATDQLVGQGGNAILLLNAFNWLVEREKLIEIDAAAPEQTRLSLSTPELLSLAAVVLLMMPASAVILGVWIGLRRRRR